mgnify:CR=1 FL=1
MPINKKEIELDNGRKIWVRQASGMERLAIETKTAKIIRQCRDFGADPSEWTEAQQQEYLDMLDDSGVGMNHQISEWVPNCILDEDIDVNMLTSEEMRTIYVFVVGQDEEGAIPLESLPE